MAKLEAVPGSVPVNEGERVVIDRFVKDLPDAWVVLPNLSINDGTGRQLDYDAIVVAPHATYVVEIKALRGDVIAAQHEWVVDNHTRKSPLNLTAHKSRVLKSVISDGDVRLRAVWTEPLVVLAAPPRSLEIAPHLRDDVLVLGRAIERMLDPDRLHRPSGNPVTVDPALVAAAVRQPARPRQAPERYREWQVVEVVSDDGEESERIVEHALTKQRARLKLVSLSPYLAREERERRMERLTRDAVALARMGHHPNIAGTTDVFEDDMGRLILVAEDSPGVTLSILLEEGLDLSEEERRAAAKDACAGLAHAHAGSATPDASYTA